MDLLGVKTAKCRSHNPQVMCLKIFFEFGSKEGWRIPIDVGVTHVFAPSSVSIVDLIIVYRPIPTPL